MHDDVKARDIVVPILERVLGPLGLESLEVIGDLDHDGDPILLAVARYKSVTQKGG